MVSPHLPLNCPRQNVNSPSIAFHYRNPYLHASIAGRFYYYSERILALEACPQKLIFYKHELSRLDLRFGLDSIPGHVSEQPPKAA